MRKSLKISLVFSVVTLGVATASFIKAADRLGRTLSKINKEFKNNE